MFDSNFMLRWYMDSRARKEDKVSGIQDKRKKTKCLPDNAIGTFTNDI